MSRTFSTRSALLLSAVTAVLGGAAGAGTVLLVGEGIGTFGASAALEQADAAPGVARRDTPGVPPEVPRSGAGELDEGARTALATDDGDSLGDERSPAALSAALEEAAAERSQLAATLIDQSRAIESLEQAIGAFNLPGGEAFGDASSEGGGAPAIEPAPGGGSARTGRNGIDIEGLLAAGVDPLVSAELERRNDAWQLARLQLVDRAAREGWDDSDQLDRQLEQLDEERPDLREELGEDGYDAYLYAAGRSNRVEVVSVIPGSAAEAAGVQANDILLGYAGERLFDVRSLQRATRAGSLGELVTVRISRDGQSSQLSIQRGPMGVSLGPVRREP